MATDNNGNRTSHPDSATRLPPASIRQVRKLEGNMEGGLLYRRERMIIPSWV
jgi:hypothetical protein